MEKKVSAILLAAGGSTRMGLDADGKRINKLLEPLCGMNAIERCVLRFAALADELVIAASEQNLEAAQKAALLSSVPVTIVPGGERRQDSVLNGLKAAKHEIAAIHDCARCLVTEEVIAKAIASAGEYGSGVPAINVRDTLRRTGTGETVERDGLVRMQTPQCFDREKLIEAYAQAGSVTDDAAIWQGVYEQVRLTAGSPVNEKLTERDDVEFFKRLIRGESEMRIGIGEDTHRLVEGRRLILGGVDIPYRLGLLGHSDADALIHAVMDAMLGAAAMGDIGRHFPDKDPAYEGISSLILLEKVNEMLKKNGFAVSNIDAVVIAQEPKLAPFIDEMRKKTADALGVGIDRIGIKATTPEHTGPEGNSECITVRAVACIRG